MKATVKKTRIYKVEDLKAGDVLFVIWDKGMERNPSMPKCNFRSIMTVTSTEKLSDGTMVFHHKNPGTLVSETGEHEIVKGFEVPWVTTEENRKFFHDNGYMTSTFGANHPITERYRVFRLDNITSKYPNWNTGTVRLKGNPAYDLMM